MQPLRPQLLPASPASLPRRLQVADMLAEGAGKVRLADADFEFHPVKTWLGRQATEKIEGWETEVGRGRGRGRVGGVLRGTEE